MDQSDHESCEVEQEYDYCTFCNQEGLVHDKYRDVIIDKYVVRCTKCINTDLCYLCNVDGATIVHPWDKIRSDVDRTLTPILFHQECDHEYTKLYQEFSLNSCNKCCIAVKSSCSYDSKCQGYMDYCIGCSDKLYNGYNYCTNKECYSLDILPRGP